MGKGESKEKRLVRQSLLKKALSCALAAMLVTGLSPTAAFAAEGDVDAAVETETIVEEETTVEEAPDVDAGEPDADAQEEVTETEDQEQPETEEPPASSEEVLPVTGASNEDEPTFEDAPATSEVAMFSLEGEESPVALASTSKGAPVITDSNGNIIELETIGTELGEVFKSAPGGSVYLAKLPYGADVTSIKSGAHGWFKVFRADGDYVTWDYYGRGNTINELNGSSVAQYGQQFANYRSEGKLIKNAQFTDGWDYDYQDLLSDLEIDSAIPVDDVEGLVISFEDETGWGENESWTVFIQGPIQEPTVNPGPVTPEPIDPDPVDPPKPVDPDPVDKGAPLIKDDKGNAVALTKIGIETATNHKLFNTGGSVYLATLPAGSSISSLSSSHKGWFDLFYAMNDEQVTYQAYGRSPSGGEPVSNLDSSEFEKFSGDKLIKNGQFTTPGPSTTWTDHKHLLSDLTLDADIPTENVEGWIVSFVDIPTPWSNWDIGKTESWTVFIQISTVDSPDNPPVNPPDVPVDPGVSPEVEKVYTDTAAHLMSLDSSKITVASTGGEWLVLGLARSSADVPKGFFDAYLANVAQTLVDKGGVLHIAKYTEYSRVILGLTALGADVTDVAGYNLLEYLTDMDKVTWQGINGPIWALIAFDSGAYDIPTAPEGAKQTTREGLIDYILGKQLADSGWNLSGSGAADPDLTAMAIQALAPYYGKDAKVKTAVDKALQCLSTMQRSDGGYASWGTVNAESCAQVVVALCVLGLDPATDARFVKNERSVLDALMSFAVEDGGFRHVASGAYNQMASEQGYYALAAYERFKSGKKSLYDMTDVVGAEELTPIDPVKPGPSVKPLDPIKPVDPIKPGKPTISGGTTSVGNTGSTGTTTKPTTPTKPQTPTKPSTTTASATPSGTSAGRLPVTLGGSTFSLGNRAFTTVAGATGVRGGTGAAAGAAAAGAADGATAAEARIADDAVPMAAGEQEVVATRRLINDDPVPLAGEALPQNEAPWFWLVLVIAGAGALALVLAAKRREDKQVA